MGQFDKHGGPLGRAWPRSGVDPPSADGFQWNQQKPFEIWCQQTGMKFPDSLATIPNQDTAK